MSLSRAGERRHTDTQCGNYSFSSAQKVAWIVNPDAYRKLTHLEFGFPQTKEVTTRIHKELNPIVIDGEFVVPTNFEHLEHSRFHGGFEPTGSK